MKKLKLFYFDECPYCQKVIGYMKENNIEVEMANIQTDQKNREELIEIGGKVQVPMLSIDGEALYESDDIIEWFKNNI
ncbi:MAG TPA: glutathione S-transferase N-terminal domain-containing protein [Tissierellaceae bacterium]|nr:glutathione S-transferase N-terminal domain-containing protein [Tissierellaceae bacterium]